MAIVITIGVSRRERIKRATSNLLKALSAERLSEDERREVIEELSKTVFLEQPKPTIH